MYGGSAITELAALGAAVGESLVAADLAALVSQKRVARLRNVSSAGSLSSMTGGAPLLASAQIVVAVICHQFFVELSACQHWNDESLPCIVSNPTIVTPQHSDQNSSNCLS
jgi:hypothetical protein